MGIIGTETPWICGYDRAFMLSSSKEQFHLVGAVGSLLAMPHHIILLDIRPRRHHTTQHVGIVPRVCE